MRNGEYRHLRGTVANLVGSSGGGTCFFRSAALVLDIPTATLCMGVLAGASDEELAASPEASPTPFIHAWVEQGDIVFSPTQIEREGGLTRWPKSVYYETNGVRNAHRIDRASLLKLAGAIGLSAHLRLGRALKTDASFAFMLLDMVGMPYAVAKDGGLVPPEYADD